MSFLCLYYTIYLHNVNTNYKNNLNFIFAKALAIEFDSCYNHKSESAYPRLKDGRGLFFFSPFPLCRIMSCGLRHTFLLYLHHRQSWQTEQPSSFGKGCLRQLRVKYITASPAPCLRTEQEIIFLFREDSPPTPPECLPRRRAPRR